MEPSRPHPDTVPRGTAVTAADEAPAVAALQARLAQALQAQAAAEHRAQQAERGKTAFLAQMSHELRTPLSGLLGLTELALQRAQEDSQRRYLTVALQSGRSLLQVINDVLDMASLNDAEPLLADEPFDLGDVLADAMRSVTPLLGDKPVVARFDIEGGPTSVRGDPARLRQVLVNLLGNAAKFTEQGTVTLSATVQPAAAPGQVALRVEVADTGPGMPPEVLARVFEPFFRAGADKTATPQGTGLGLAIAHGLVSAMRGSLGVRSTLGQGTTFTLDLALPLDSEAMPETLPPPGIAWLLSARADEGWWVQRRLERLGWTAEVVVGLDAALARACSERGPDLLLFSPRRVAVTPKDLRALQQALPTTRLQLLIRPDWSDTALEAEAQRQDVGRSVLPLSPRALNALLRHSARPAPAAWAGAARPDGAEVLLVEDNEINRVIGQHLLELLGLRVRCAPDGAQSLQACLAQPPALVLMDVRMPVMDGLEATRQLRALQREGRLPPFPVVGLSAHALDTDRRVALDAGMDDYLTKPVDAEQLRSAMQRWVHEARP
jgi:signal transduction histidine kinase/CheY-like chemotaxis protein